MVGGWDITLSPDVPALTGTVGGGTRIQQKLAHVM